MQHILTGSQYTETEQLEKIFYLARYFKSHKQSPTVATRLKNKVIASIFFEPSTRTRLSFESAAHRLGANVISCENAKTSGSAVKGESIEDSAKVISGYADLMIIRHPEKNSVMRAAKNSSVPVINAGDGSGQHPTQALLDIFTICDKLGTLEDKILTIAGDLKHSRTMHSTMLLASLYPGITVNLVSPESLQTPQDILNELNKRGVKINIYIKTGIKL